MSGSGSPQVFLPPINRIRGNVQVQNFPALNVTASFLGKGGFEVTWNSPATTMLPTMTGRVASPEPYQAVTVGMHLVKSQSLASAWEAQRVALSTIGNILVFTTSRALAPYSFVNMAIENVGALTESGESVEYMVTLTGTYIINNNLWALTI